MREQTITRSLHSLQVHVPDAIIAHRRTGLTRQVPDLDRSRRWRRWRRRTWVV